MNKNMKKIGLLLAVPLSVMAVEALSPIEAHAETTGIEWIKSNWLNYPSGVGKWNVATVNGKTALGSTQNTSWSGYLNTYALETKDAEFTFKMYQNESGDDDNMGWTFRHTYTGSYTNINNHSFYVFVSNGGGATASGIYKKEVGKSASQLTKLATFTHKRAKKTEYAVKIDVKDEAGGTRIKAYIDGKLVADVLDTSPLENGGYGPYSYSQAYAYYYDINVNGASFLNIPPESTATSSIRQGEVLISGDTINISGTATDKDKSGELRAYYRFDNGEEYPLDGTIKNDVLSYNHNLVVPSTLKYGEHTLYVYAKDSDNAESKRQAFKFFVNDVTPPEVTSTTTATDETRATFVINIKATDVGTGVKRIQLPNGNYINGAEADFTVNDNGDYTFLVEDNLGNINTYVVNVSEYLQKQKHMVKVIGTFYATTLDVRLPIMSSFLYNPNTEMMTSQKLRIENYTNAPIYMKLKNIGIAPDSKWSPNLVRPDKHSNIEWKNLTKGQSSEEVALGLNIDKTKGWLKYSSENEYWATQFSANDDIGYIRNKGAIEVEPLLKSGTSLGVNNILTANYVYEFGL